MNEEQQDVKVPSINFMDEKLFKSRSISIFGNINERIARSVAEQLLALSAESTDPITIYISSPGGHVESGDVIYDMIKFIKPEVRCIGSGWVASAGALIFVAAEKKNRLCLPNTRFLLHQPSGGIGGQATDMQIQAEQIRIMRDRFDKIFAEAQGKMNEKLSKIESV